MTETDPPPRPRRRRMRRAGGWLLSLSLTLTLAVAVLAAVAIIALTGRPISAPEIVQQGIEARLAEALPQARVSFGEMVVVVDRGWLPRVRLRDIAVETPDGQEIIHFQEMKASFAMRPLLSGRLEPRDIAITGVVARLERNAEGKMSLTAGAGAAPPAREAATLPQLIGQVDRLLASPALAELSSVELRALTLRYDDLRADRGWTVDGGRLLLNREDEALTINADLALLSGGAGAATLSASYSSQIGETAADFGVSFEGVDAADIAAQGPVFAWLDVLRAPISGSVRSGIEPSGRFAPLAATLTIGAGVVQPNSRTRPIPFEGARSYFSYDPADRLLRFDEVSVQSKWVGGEASGTATLGIDEEGGRLSDLVGQFRLRGLTANPNGLYPEPVTLEEADIDFQLKLKPFRVQIGRLQISDAGRTLLASGALTAEEAGWRLAIDGQMDAVSPERVLALWPPALVPKTRDWLEENLWKGTLTGIDLALRRAPEEKLHSYLAFDYEDATVQFMRTMPPITGGRGHMSLDGPRLVVTVDEGRVAAPQGGPVDVAGSSFIIPDVGIKDFTPAVIRLDTRSSITAALSLLDQEPLNVMSKANLPVALAEGRADLAGTLSLPLEKNAPREMTRYHFEGELMDLASDVLIKDRLLEADRLTLAADNDALRIGGRGRLDGVGFDGSWEQPIGPGSPGSSLAGEVAITQNTLDAFGITLPPGTMSGETTGRIALNFAKGQAPRFRLTSDLRGARLSVPQLSWVKGQGTAGALTVAGALGPVPSVDTLSIDAPGLDASGSVSLGAGGALERVRFDRLRRGGWLDVPVDLVGQGKGNPVQVVLRGGTLDLREAEFGKAEASGGPGAPMQVTLDRLQITDTIALTGLQGTFDTARGIDGSFRALLNDGVPVEGRVLPRNGRSAVRLVSADAGGVLRSAGLLRQVVGGNLSLTLLPIGSGGAFDGQLLVDDVRIKDAPGIAGLLNAVSVVGLVNELNGDGIYFDNVEATFRLTPNRLTLTEASAVGASMGLSMDGVYALDQNVIDMQGVFSPVYLLNGIGSVLTRKGEGLFGFNYTLRGPVKQPAVSVNPLSALTPGMFREIFRAPPPELPPVEGVTDSAIAPLRPPPNKPVVREYRGR
jgi:hypothetical protein